jgi:hypothetical protein
MITRFFAFINRHIFFHFGCYDLRTTLRAAARRACLLFILRTRFSHLEPLQTEYDFTRLAAAQCVCPAWAYGIKDTILFQRVKVSHRRVGEAY